jgi:hypothetical protein
MYADAPPLALFTFSIYDLSGAVVGPLWERFVQCQADGNLDWEALYEQVEMLLDYAGIEEMERVRVYEWESYTTHKIPEWKGRPAVVRGRVAPGAGSAGGKVPGLPDGI